ncbi:hypothetical protein DSD19_13705 [Rhodovulum sp. BSW8]|uniref:hypothetical protein n=1 Tax=Rhodovulum sp. BSW8 TaxID=2259645 RepID=UPI000DE2AC90|nr:hypothetical protein [Rhodovulum sp. BSW8]RBO52639.1 hypothetical protein DSD19_13705 [Rhodovulum sp. BSW8]
MPDTPTAAQADYAARVLSAIEPTGELARLRTENARLREALEKASVALDLFDKRPVLADPQAMISAVNSARIAAARIRTALRQEGREDG